MAWSTKASLRWRVLVGRVMIRRMLVGKSVSWENEDWWLHWSLYSHGCSVDGNSKIRTITTGHFGSVLEGCNVTFPILSRLSSCRFTILLILDGGACFQNILNWIFNKGLCLFQACGAFISSIACDLGVSVEYVDSTSPISSCRLDHPKYILPRGLKWLLVPFKTSSLVFQP